MASLNESITFCCATPLQAIPKRKIKRVNFLIALSYCQKKYSLENHIFKTA
jgi:hypothetical protein